MRWSAAWLYGALVGAVLIAGGFMWYEWERLPQPRAPEPLWPRLQAYPLIDSDGRPLALDAFTGRVVILTFIYTHCPSVCPRLSSTIREILQETPAGAPVMALSISLDPERDTGTALTAYKQAYAVAGHNWWYVRPLSQNHAFLMARDVFGLTAAKLPGNNDEIMHSDAFFLVSCTGEVYGPYTSADNKKAKKDLQKLIRLCKGSSSG